MAARGGRGWGLVLGGGIVLALIVAARRSSSTPSAAPSAGPGSWFPSESSAASAGASFVPFAPVNPFDPSGGFNVLDLNSFTPANSSLAQRRAAFAPLFEAISAKYGLPAGLLARQGEVESNLLPGASSSAGAVGLMQMLPRYFPGAGRDAATDIDTAAQEMARLFNVFGSWTLALAAYNAGQGNVQQYGNRVPPFAETRNYIAKILPATGITEPDVEYA